MSDWQSVTAVALVGTARRSLPDLPEGLPEGDPEQSLLRALAYLSVNRLVSAPLPSFDQPRWPACPPDPRPLPPAAARARLAILLDSDEPGLVGEWLRSANAAGCRLPGTLLPSLLDRALTDLRSIRSLVLAVAGQRGRWLAAQNPLWSSLALFADPVGAFREGNRAVRVQAFEQIRDDDPGQALGLLTQIWPAESTQMRTELLGCLARGLSDVDEDFLESALADPAAAVRAVAQDLLCQIPDSRFLERMRRRAQNLIRMRRGRTGPRVDVNLREEYPPDLVADGFPSRPPRGPGLKAWLTAEIVALTPPDLWPLDALAGFLESEWAGPLVTGIVRAVARFGHREWAEAVLLLSARPNRGLGLEIDVRALALGLGEAEREALVLTLIGRAPVLATEVLRHIQEPWSEALSTAALRDLRVLANTSDGLSRYLQILYAARLLASPGVVPIAEALLEGADRRGLESVLQRLIDTLRLRSQIHEEFERS